MVMCKSSAVLFLPWDSSPTCPFILEMFYSNLFLLRGGERKVWIVVKMVSFFCEVETVHREELEADLSDSVPASCYRGTIIKSLQKYCPALTLMLY